MKLRTYIDLKHRGNKAAFARLIGSSTTAVLRYCDDPPRVPTPSVMKEIVRVTGGEVTPNDFFCALHQSEQGGSVKKKRKQRQTKEH